MRPEYAAGGVEFYDKTLSRNLALRSVSGARVVVEKFVVSGNCREREENLYTLELGTRSRD